ncbi:MAG TPA: glycerate kinase, partial [Verrucomicrobiales bacterium]|nr:glycerate kinase [Verrucomicrobiales bacterium]
MKLRVLVAPDKFKGTLTAVEAAAAIGAGWSGVRPGDELSLLPMSDGGDGFGALLGAILGAEGRRVETCDAAHRPCQSEWWWEPRERLAIVEAARANGLAQLPPGRFHPFELDTRGLAAVFQAASAAGARRCLVGIGGSATNDGGFGLAHALGWRFLDREARPIERWTELERLERIEPPVAGPRFEEVRVAVDVQNPLLGPEGCSRIYGPQKGLRSEDFPLADRSLGRLADAVRVLTGQDIAGWPGAGAAGGLGFGLCAFLQGRLTPGFELFAGYAGFRERILGADLVITAEGSIDASSLMGKGVGGVAALCRELHRPCL